MKGQGSTEYLVILAVVLVVALIVIGLLGGFTGFGVSGSESQSQAYWRGASPFSIQTVMISPTTGVALLVQSKSSERLVLNSISFGGPALANSSQTFAPGASIRILDAGATTGYCFNGQYSVDVTFDYDVGKITGQIQKGDKALIGKCS